MWKFELTIPDDLLSKFQALAAAHNLTPMVTAAVCETTQRTEKLTSQEWLIGHMVKNDPLALYTARSVGGRLRRHAWPNLEVVSGLTLEAFLRRRTGLGRGFFMAMAELGVTFACGANPANFPEFKIKEEEFTWWDLLWQWELTSWAMFAYE